MKRYSVLNGIVSMAILAIVGVSVVAAPQATAKATEKPAITILVDDFLPQTYAGEPTDFYDRLDGDRKLINDIKVKWDRGQVIATIPAGKSWGGVAMGLNHPLDEGLPINFSAVLPTQILPAYQSKITGITVGIAKSTKNRTFRLELKNGGAFRWTGEIDLNGGEQAASFDLPALGDINELVWVLDHASAGDFVILDSIAFTATTQITDTATRAFVWSYGQLLNNWNPKTGLVRDKARDASGELDAIQATGSLAAASAQANQLGIISRGDAIKIVDRISQALLAETPRYRGLWPHFVKVSPAGIITIAAPDVEWSSVDTVIAAVGLLTAQNALGMDTFATEHMLRTIDWNGLIGKTGMISMGYDYYGKKLTTTKDGKQVDLEWDVFGGESWLVGLAYAGATGKVAAIASPKPPTANGSGFIDELAWLFTPPPSKPDYWGTDWTKYRVEAADAQISYYPEKYPESCLAKMGLFGLSAAEVPDPTLMPRGKGVYQTLGVGGAEASQSNERVATPPKDGSNLMGAPYVVPHYAGLLASLRPQEAIKMWDWLIKGGLMSPLNNVESLMFPAGSKCEPQAGVWNHLKGSWNLSLQTLGWGRYLAERRGQLPVLWQATTTNPLLSRGYRLLAPKEATPTLTPTSKPSATPTPTLTPWSISRECEKPDKSTVGETQNSPNASGGLVHGLFGAVSGPNDTWPAKSGYVRYTNIKLPQTDHLYLRLHYSKFSPPSVPIRIYVDDGPAPAASYQPIDQGSWDKFAWTEPILLGSIQSGVHSITFATDGQEYGVADLDEFVLASEP